MLFSLFEFHFSGIQLLVECFDVLFIILAFPFLFIDVTGIDTVPRLQAGFNQSFSFQPKKGIFFLSQ